MVTAKKVEERWTSTSIHAVFALPPLSGNPKDGAISVNLPLLNLGWTFALSLSPESHRKTAKRCVSMKSSKSVSTSSSIQTHDWIPVALTFHRRGRVTIPWGNASMHAELSLTTDPPAANDSLSVANIADPCATGTPLCPSNSLILLVTMEKIALVHSHSLEIQLEPRTISLLSPSKVSLTLTISECPPSVGLFHVTSDSADEADAQKWLVKQNGEHLLSRSLTTGTVYDTKFLAHAVHSISKSGGESLLESYARLSVLKGHVDPSLARPSDSEAWTTALATLDYHENPDAKPVSEIPCPDGYEYELDSDYDEDEAVEKVISLLPGEHDLVILQGEESDTRTGEFGNPFSSFERGRVSDVSSLDSLPEEYIKDQEVPPDSSSRITTKCERTIVIEFAAYRTWHAFLWYCYTGHIDFCELKSQAEHGVRRLRVVGDGPPSCSPKSMYRLADLVGDKDLKDLALNAIRERMIKTNVLDETFSVFTSKYPDVREAQLDALIEQRASPEVKKAFLEKISKYDAMPHAESTLEAFYDRFATMSVIPAPTCLPAAARPT